MSEPPEGKRKRKYPSKEQRKVATTGVDVLTLFYRRKS
jgi:hypothetical protein